MVHWPLCGELDHTCAQPSHQEIGARRTTGFSTSFTTVDLCAIMTLSAAAGAPIASTMAHPIHPRQTGGVVRSVWPQEGRDENPAIRTAAVAFFLMAVLFLLAILARGFL